MDTRKKSRFWIAPNVVILSKESGVGHGVVGNDSQGDWPNFHCNEANIITKVSARRESLHLFDDLMTQLKSGQFTAFIHSFKQAPIVIDVSAGSLNFK